MRRGGVVDISFSTRAGTPTRSAIRVVLGAAQYDGTPSDVYAARLDHAASHAEILAERGLLRRLHALHRHIGD